MLLNPDESNYTNSAGFYTPGCFSASIPIHLAIDVGACMNISEEA